MIFEIEIG